MNLNYVLYFVLFGVVIVCLSVLFLVVRIGILIKICFCSVVYLFILILLVVGFYLVEVWYDLFFILGMCIGIYVLFCLLGICMCLVFLCGVICWLINNIIVGFIGGILFEVMLLVVNSFIIICLYRG